MITSQSSTIPEIHGLILLDCWEPPTHKFFTEIFYVKMIDHLQKYNFECIVNSLSNSQFDQNDPGLANTLALYGRPRKDVAGRPDEDDRHDLRRYRVVTNIFKSFINSPIPEENGFTAEIGSSLIKKYLFKPNAHKCMFLTIHEDFFYHATTHLPACKNWLVVGQSWQMCTHEHSLGLKNLSQLPGMSFYATDFGFCKKDGGTAGYEDFASDSLAWEHVENFGYMLKPVTE